MAKGKKKLKKWSFRRAAPKETVSLQPAPWDMGAAGQANRVGLVEEPRGEVDPETGKRANPNGVRGERRISSAERGQSIGALDRAHVLAAHELRAMSEGGLLSGGDPIAAISIKTPDGGKSDPLAVAFDMRRRFHDAWNKIPKECHDAVERSVINDLPQEDAFGRKLCDIIDGYAKVRVGLRAAFGELE